MKHQSKSERPSGREFIVSRVINGPSKLVFEAWSNAEKFKQWWVPKGAPMTLLSCDVEMRVGGKYRLKLSGRMKKVVKPNKL